MRYDFFCSSFSRAANVLWAELCPNPIRRDNDLHSSIVHSLLFQYLSVEDKTWVQTGQRLWLFYIYRWYVDMKCVRDLCMCVCVCVCVCVCDRESVLLWWFSRQVGDQRGDGTDVRDDPKHNGEHREPQSLARRCVRPLKIPLSRRLVGLEERGERDKDF